MHKNLPKFVKHIFPSDKQWTGVWFSKYRDIYTPFCGQNIVLVDIYDYYCLYSPQERLTTTKVPSVMSMFSAFAKRPEPES
jgi:hypothetical protein